ncbi:glycosyltransferase family 2 protein [Halorubrum ezzemoulense]|uniref:glycosyltransferase n=1 Tax=Halorubrum ezzemoulense TaxID=337243 RepID=UPI00232EA6A9|nr:glycosyltransferase family 2 protein [Halorubrum ezzemoulense]MDB2272607.1 glycosyltransferase family 2 protein [Halorubrum ezzemoulense]
MTAVTVALNIFQTGLPVSLRIIILTLGLQALLLTVDVRPTDAAQQARILLLIVSHGAVFGGSLLIFPSRIQNQEAAILLYVVGFSFLILHAFWMRRLRPGISPPRPETRRRAWESIVLIAILVVVISTLIFVTVTTGLTTDSQFINGFVIVGGFAGTILLASLSVPRQPPSFVNIFTGPFATIVQHVLTLILLVNTLFVALFIAFPPVFTLITGGFLLLLAAGVTVNYLMTLLAVVRSQDQMSPSGSLTADIPFTVVVTAMNEANVVRETLRENLIELPNAEFLIVPAAASDDGTHAVLADIASEFPDQVRIETGDAGSKAGDLNQIWPLINTPFVLILDADERANRDSVARGLQTLLSNPKTGIVQGRKVATYPSSTNLSRFITIERQHSTWIDHPFMDGAFHAGHFAGSSALLRRPVVSDINGFSTTTLTEDIDLAIRTYLETDWDIQYDSTSIFYEYNPNSWTSLIRQRERWGRGWAQCAARYLPTVLSNGKQLGWRRTTGLSWELFLSVSSPVYTIFPAIIAYWILSGGPPFASWITLSFALIMIPERGISFLYALLWDPELSEDRTAVEIVSALFYSYLWIPFGWVIQLHSLYLQLAGAVERWDVTKKGVKDGKTQ